MSYQESSPFPPYPDGGQQPVHYQAAVQNDQYPSQTTSCVSPVASNMPYPNVSPDMIPPPFPNTTLQPHPDAPQISMPGVYPDAPVAPQPMGFPEAAITPTNAVISQNINVVVSIASETPTEAATHNLPTILPAQQPPWRPDRNTKYSGKDIADEDLGEHDPEEVVVLPPPPPYSASIEGYDDVKYQHEQVVQAPAINVKASKYTDDVNASNIPDLTEDDAKDALVELAKSECCWGTKAAKKLDVNEIVATGVHHYTLESFTERRSYWYDYKPYKGGPIDDIAEPAPKTWDIKCKPQDLFQNETRTIDVPHTEIAMGCFGCLERGFNRCNKCQGRGKLRCATCDGKKTVLTKVEGSEEEKEVDCNSCEAQGRKECIKCSGIGCVMCTTCQGYRRILQYLKITVTYSNRVSEYIKGGSGVADHLIKEVSGQTVFQHTAELVSPIENFCDGEVNNKSQSLLDSHKTSWPEDRILQQRHSLRTVPVHNCLFEYKDETGRFYVFGYERRVITNDYPHTCYRCRCAIL